MIHPRGLAATLILVLVPLVACTPEEARQTVLKAYNVEISQAEAEAISDYVNNPPAPPRVKSVQEKIIDKWAGTPHVQRALNIARCESGFIPTAKNQLPGSTASGVFQIINSTFRAYADPGMNVFDTDDNIEVAWRIYTGDGGSFRQWECKG